MHSRSRLPSVVIESVKSDHPGYKEWRIDGKMPPRSEDWSMMAKNELNYKN